MKKIHISSEKQQELFSNFLANSEKNEFAYAKLHEKINDNIYHDGFTQFSCNDHNEILHFSGYTLVVDGKFFSQVDKEYFLNKIRPYYLKINNTSLTFKDERGYYYFALLIGDDIALQLAQEFFLDMCLLTYRFDNPKSEGNDKTLKPEWRRYYPAEQGDFFGITLNN